VSGFNIRKYGGVLSIFRSIRNVFVTAYFERPLVEASGNFVLPSG